jgi:hypothetical protein
MDNKLIGEIVTDIVKNTENTLTLKSSQKASFSCFRKIHGDDLTYQTYNNEFKPEVFEIDVTFIGQFGGKDMNFISPAIMEYIILPVISILNDKYIISSTFDKNYLSQISGGEYITCDLNTNNEGIIILLSLLFMDTITKYLEDEEKEIDFKDQLKKIKLMEIDLVSKNYMSGSYTLSHSIEIPTPK